MRRVALALPPIKKRLLLPLPLLAFSAAMAALSGGFLEFDEITHFLKAREVFRNWRMLLDIWGRPACTGIYAVPAALGGIVAARLMAVVVTAVVGWGTMTLQAELARREMPATTDPSAPNGGYFVRTGAGWVWLLLYAQPLFLLNSFTVMTEMLLACAWIWGAVLLARGRLRWAGLVVGLGALARPEGWIAAALWGAFLWLWYVLGCARAVRWKEVALSWALALAPTFAWWAIGAVAFQRPGWMVDFFPWQAASPYGPTGLIFLLSALVALALWMWVPMLVGAVVTWQRHERPAFVLLAVPTAAFFLLHGVLGVFGLFGSMSLPRYFLCVAPFIALLSLRGLEAWESRSRRPRWLRKGVILLTILPVVLLLAASQLPIPEGTEERQLDVAVRAFEKRVPTAERITKLLAEHPYVYYRAGLPLDTVTHERIYSAKGIASAPPGTILITDASLWDREGRPDQEELLRDGYRLDLTLINDISSVPQVFTLSSLSNRRGEMGVGLWIKER